MILSSTIRYFERSSFGRALFSPARLLWRWGFAIRCEIIAARELRSRATLVLLSPDLDRLAPVPDAGRVRAGVQIMHNGVLVEEACYYGRGSVALLRRTRGIHEPQEEIAFAEVLRHIAPGSTMLELGSYWAFYSIWFARAIPGAHCHLVEPNAANLALGPRNFQLNGLSPASVTRCFIGANPGRTPDGIQITTVDRLAEKLGLAHIHLLHADIQLFERDMLDGARHLITGQKIDYVFISTHADEIHVSCRDFLTAHNFTLLMDVSQAESFSIDGTLVARRQALAGPAKISIAVRSVGA